MAKDAAAEAEEAEIVRAREESAKRIAEAQEKLALFVAEHTPPGGWPAKTINAANDAINAAAGYPVVKITQGMRRRAEADSKRLGKRQTDP